MEVTVTLDHYNSYANIRREGRRISSICATCAVQQALRPVFGDNCVVGYSEVWTDEDGYRVATLPPEVRRLIEKIDSASVQKPGNFMEQELLPGFPYTFDLEPFLG